MVEMSNRGTYNNRQQEGVHLLSEQRAVGYGRHWPHTDDDIEYVLGLCDRSVLVSVHVVVSDVTVLCGIGTCQGRCYEGGMGVDVRKVGWG